ncbi:hypothetical protein [Frankia sp. AgKG'84/4]|uniref:hypothetical protein n=1 Tax=Frankia sp. AgKG'84/4 TaxID=573490 RepID=UPI00200F1C5C|nr:hypothetical protein [Frankia sp. AgKG'84/4]MCL9797866.1 hypothetical protein [Frankia sp. AgKG'84/4]
MHHRALKEDDDVERWTPEASVLRPVRDALAAGAAVVLPNPPPLTYLVVGTSPTAVNTAKGRPYDQEVALWITRDAQLGELAAALALDGEGMALARRLLVAERVTLLVPLRAGQAAPHWLAPSVRDAHALLFGARWAPLRPLVRGFTALYVSSANRTGRRPAARAAQARVMFGERIPVLDGDAWPGAALRRGATTMLRLRPDATIEHVRPGAQDSAHADPAAYLAWLRWASASARPV